MTKLFNTRTLAIASIALASAILALSVWWVAQTLWLHKDPTVVVDTTAAVNPGSFVSYELDLKQAAHVLLAVDVSEGLELDLFVLSTVQFVKYQEAVRTGIALPFQASLSVGGIRHIVQTVQLEPGTYVVVLDHTSVGPTRPPSSFASLFNHRPAQAKVRITKE
ncbi:MAG: hypothetical protein QXD59_05925 [Candidatus Caldarchaeum sp.]